jgi:hypothetical protein
MELFNWKKFNKMIIWKTVKKVLITVKYINQRLKLEIEIPEEDFP